jgi:hypothetical protein
VKVAHSLDELVRYRGCIVAECVCGRSALFSIAALIALCKERRWSRDFREVRARFRCTGCGKRNPKAYFAQPPVPTWVGLAMVVQPPPGVGAVQWARADSGERKRIIQNRRG